MPIAIAQASHPTTLKNLDRHERIRLMHLGAPLDNATSFLDMVSPTIAEFIDTAPSMPSTPITPIPQAMGMSRYVKRQRRQGRIFENSAAYSSTSSLDSIQSSGSEQSEASSASSSYSTPSSPCSLASFESQLQVPPPVPPKPIASTSSSFVLQETQPLRIPTKKPLPAPLLLRFRAAPSKFLPHPPSPSLRFDEALVRPISPPISPQYTNVSPTTAERRQRRLNKLTRTLGEIVPMDLIQTPVAQITTFAQERQRVVTHKYSHSETLLTSSMSPYPSYAHGHGHGRGRSMGVTAVGLHYASQLSLENTNSGADVLERATSRVERPSRANTSYSRNPLRLLSHRRHGGPIRRNTNANTNTNTTGVGARTGLDWGKRKEKEWSGEWNLRDLKDVMRGLRELKGR